MNKKTVSEKAISYHESRVRLGTKDCPAASSSVHCADSHQLLYHHGMSWGTSWVEIMVGSCDTWRTGIFAQLGQDH